MFSENAAFYFVCSSKRRISAAPRCSGVSLTMTWCPGVRKRRPSSTTTGATTMTSPCGTAPMPTCWFTSGSRSSVSGAGVSCPGCAKLAAGP